MPQTVRRAHTSDQVPFQSVLERFFLRRWWRALQLSHGTDEGVSDDMSPFGKLGKSASGCPFHVLDTTKAVTPVIAAPTSSAAKAVLRFIVDIPTLPTLRCLGTQQSSRRPLVWIV